MSIVLSEKATKVKSSSTLAITAKAKELKASGLDVITFSVGEPDFPTPKNICDAAMRAINSGKTKYTDAAGLPELRKAISKKFKEYNGIDYAPEQIVVSNGGKQSLQNIFTAIINPGDEVIIPTPFWLSYPEMVRLSGGTPVFVNCDKENDYKITAEKIAGAVTPNTKAIVINSPHNPTGHVYSEEELKEIGELAVKYDFYVIADEMYEVLNYSDEKCVSMASLSSEIYEHTITVSGVSKSYAMTGWRIGYLGCPKGMAKVISSIQSHQTSNPSSVSQYAAIEALTGPQDELYKMKEAFAKRRDYIYERALQMPYIETVKPQGAFYLFIDFSGVIGKTYEGNVINDASDVAKILIDKYLIAVTPCLDFGMKNHIRISYAVSDDDIKRGMDRLEEFLKAL